MNSIYDTFELQGFSHWACALFNGDTTGLEDDDETLMDEWLEQVPSDFYGPVDMTEDGFHARVYDGLGGDAATYVFIRQRPVEYVS